MSVLFFVVVFIVVLLAVYMGTYSGRLRVDEECLIPAPLERVEAAVRDFSTWPAWHPWLEHDEAAKPEISGQATAVGAQFRWASQSAGQGSVTHRRFMGGGRIVQALAVQTPFGYRGRIEWELAAEGGQTRVHWRMRGRVGF